MADHMMTKKKTKKRGRSNLFRSCFRSFSDERPLLNDKLDRRSTDNGRLGLGKPVLVAASGREEDDVVLDLNTVNGNGNRVDCNSERSCHGRTVSRLFKAVLFDSVMVKKYRSSSKSSIASDTSESLTSIEKTCKQSDDSNACIIESTGTEDSSSHCSNLLSSSSRTTSSSYSSSSSSSSTNSYSRWLSDQKTSSPLHTADSNHPISSNSQKPNLLISNSQTDSISLPLSKSNSLHQSQLDDSIDSSNAVTFNLNIRWCLFLLLSLIVLVVYGRIYAILCTSIWFYLMPCQRVKRVDSVTNSVSVMDTESEQYKKRVIMAGLLDRTRNPLR